MTISRVRTVPGGTDAYGDPTPGTSTSTVIDGAFTAPRLSNDLSDAGRVGVIIGLTLFMPYGYDLLHSDKVDVDGTLYRVDGDPGDWHQPMTGWNAGSTVALVRVEG